ncbi:MAG: OadG family protein [bacterium]|nr:OadG family protein [bacterium]
MELKDALMITGLGISMVFIGLMLTNLMIHSFTVVPKMWNALKKKEQPQEAPVQLVEAEADIEPEIISVITAVLEVEFRKMSLLEGKFTFK